MATNVRLVRKVGATASMLVRGVYPGHGGKAGDPLVRTKQEVYVPATGTAGILSAAGLETTTSVQGYIDLGYTMDVQRMLASGGSIYQMLAEGELSSAASFDDTALAAPVLTSAALVSATPPYIVEHLSLVGLRLISMTPEVTSVSFTLPGKATGVTGGATKNTVAATVLTLSDASGVNKSFIVTASAVLANAALAKELMQGFEDDGFDAFVDYDAGTGAFTLYSVNGTLTVVASTLATALGITVGAYAPTTRGRMTQAQIEAGGSIATAEIQINATNPSLPAAIATGDFIKVVAGGSIATRSVVYDGETFTVNFIKMPA